MKIKGTLIAYAVISILGLMLMLSRENVYVVIALVIGLILLGHRELWSLVRHRRLPVLDDRVRENLSKAMRITGVFFFVSSLVLILLIRFNVFKEIPTGLIIGGQLVIVSIVYAFGYHYYDRVRPNLGERATRWFKIFMVTGGLSLCTIAFSIAMHNLVSSWLGLEEAFFFILGLLLTPCILVISLLGSSALFLGGLWASFRSVNRA